MNKSQRHQCLDQHIRLQKVKFQYYHEENTALV
jgi:hypothetical protein